MDNAKRCCAVGGARHEEKTREEKRGFSTGDRKGVRYRYVVWGAEMGGRRGEREKKKKKGGGGESSRFMEEMCGKGW